MFHIAFANKLNLISQPFNFQTLLLPYYSPGTPIRGWWSRYFSHWFILRSFNALPTPTVYPMCFYRFFCLSCCSDAKYADLSGWFSWPLPRPFPIGNKYDYSMCSFWSKLERVEQQNKTKPSLRTVSRSHKKSMLVSNLQLPSSKRRSIKHKAMPSKQIWSNW